MKMYRLKSGGWRKHRTHISAKSWGEYDDVNCKRQADYGVMNPDPGGLQPYVRRRTLKATKSWEANYTFESGKALGTFIRVYPSSNSTIVFNGVITF